MRRLIVAAVCLAVFAALAAPPADAQEAERFNAWAVNLSNVATGSDAQVDILIKRWSTEAERNRLIETFMNKPQKALLDTLQKLPPVGVISTPGEVGWDLRYARQVPGEDGGRQIIIVTDRPMSFAEVANRPRTVDYPFTLIELRLDQDGFGEGRASVMTKITYDKENNTLELENFATEPVRLKQVKQVQ
jgi:hypothetical protein